MQSVYFCQGTTNFCAICMAYLAQVVRYLRKHTYVPSSHTSIGRHNCLWCLITSEHLKIPLATRGARPPRTLEGIKKDHDRFLANGAIHTKAKEFNNAMAPHFFDIELQEVQ